MLNNILKIIAPPPRERGRENRSFPVAEKRAPASELKPLGFKNIWPRQIFGGGAMVDFLAGKKLPGIEALKRQCYAIFLFPPSLKLWRAGARIRK